MNQKERVQRLKRHFQENMDECSIQDTEPYEFVLQTFPTQDMESHQASQKVNSVRNDSPELLKPI